MSGSGTGRGRGWLNLNKNASTPRPGGIPNTDFNDTLTKDLSATTLNCQQYPRLLSLIEQLDANDDGILLNQKLKNIIQNWTQECNSGAEVV